MLNPFLLFFFLMVIGSVFFIVSSVSWFGAWMGLEINMMSFVPMIISVYNQRYSEAALKYFLIQVFGSVLLLLGVILVCGGYEMFWLVAGVALLLKMGVAPFHFWLPVVVGGLSWLGVVVLLIIQKIGPFVLFSYLIDCLSMIFLWGVIFISLVVGALGGLNQLILRSLLAYSSIGHMGWMVGGLMVSDYCWIVYYTTYIISSMFLIIFWSELGVSHFVQLFESGGGYLFNFMFIVGLLSLGGLPPFLGFYGKWVVISGLVGMYMYMFVYFMLLVSFYILYWYIRLSYVYMLMGSGLSVWSVSDLYCSMLMLFFLLINGVGLFFFPMFVV